MPSRPRHPAIYARISKDDQDTQAGVTRQLEDCQALARQMGWPSPAEYIDNNVSAWSGALRPDYERLLADIQTGHVDAVLFWHLDRLTRKPEDFYRFMAAAHQASIAHSVHAVRGDADLTTPDGQFIAGINALVAKKSSDDTSARIKRQKRQHAEAGLPAGGRRPYGYTQDQMHINEAEAATIRDLVRRYLAGDSIGALTAWLQNSDTPTAEGHVWASGTVRRLITNPRIAGLRSYNGTVVGPAVWPAIISPDDHARVVARMKDRARAGRRAPQRNLLTGLATCGRCGHRLQGRVATSGKYRRRTYYCPPPTSLGCGRISIGADALEEFVSAAVLEAIASPELFERLSAAHHADDTTQKLIDQAATLQAQLTELAADFAEGNITKPEWFTVKKTLNAKLDAVNSQLATATRTQALTGIPNSDDLTRAWPSLSLSRQAAICESVIEQVKILPSGPAQVFNPRRVEITWRV